MTQRHQQQRTPEQEAAHRAYTETAPEAATPPVDGGGAADEEPEERAGETAAEEDAQPAEQGAAPSLEERISAVEQERDEYLEHLRRERAEFENFRKRANRERMDALDRGAEQLMASLLGVVDNFGFALEAAESSEDDQLAKGVRMVHSELLSTLTEAGLEEVPGVGSAFDPGIHEAMVQVDAETELGEEIDEPVVVEVLRPGYRFKGRVLRPASVKVAR